MTNNPLLYGLMAEFETGAELVAAAKETRAAGYRQIDAYSPQPVEGLTDAIEFRRTWVPLIVLLGGIAGAVAGYLLQYWTQAIDYPINVGGRPYNSWPMFIPITFETTILFAVLAATIAMLALNGLPMPYHPVFNVPEFARASQDRFFLVIAGDDPKFDYDATREFLQNLNPVEVADVPK